MDEYCDWVFESNESYDRYLKMENSVDIISEAKKVSKHSLTRMCDRNAQKVYVNYISCVPLHHIIKTDSSELKKSRWEQIEKWASKDRFHRAFLFDHETRINTKDLPMLDRTYQYDEPLEYGNNINEIQNDGIPEYPRVFTITNGRHRVEYARRVMNLECILANAYDTIVFPQP